jgi:alkanesulfonate monooxygenase SsuD/methylene tetrahydromethanopterin reductase-like flavin-dependent oxidoreductase (luciferase family)
MSRELSIAFSWQGNRDREAAFKRVQIADAAGVEVVFVAEAWGQDAFSLLTQLAERTKRIKLATGIVNYYSRSPAALAQHFATLDELSEGRAIIGLGASSANVIEHFHGIPFNPALARMRETVDIINMLIAGTPLNYKGRWFNLQRGFTLRFRPYRSHIPVYIASFRPKAVKVTAAIADGWLPTMIPIGRLKGEIDKFRDYARQAGRDAAALTVRAGGSVTVTKEAAKARQASKENTAFYVARMGDFYYQQLCDMGFAGEVNEIRRAWREGGSQAGYAAVPDSLTDALGAFGSLEACRERLVEQDAAGATLHGVSIEGEGSPLAEGRIYEQLMK